MLMRMRMPTVVVIVRMIVVVVMPGLHFGMIVRVVMLMVMCRDDRLTGR